MNETLNDAIDVLGMLQFETGGPLLDHIISLKGELVVERQRRIDELRKAGMTDAQIGPPLTATNPSLTSRPVECRKTAS